MTKEQRYEQVLGRLRALMAGETDEVACLATVACEVFHAFDAFHWVGFYRMTGERELSVGPYQGGHGCLKISFDRGVCGAAARTGEVQLVPDVNAITDHIACSSTTQSEIVLPVFDTAGELKAVFDIDSDALDQFDATDERCLSEICKMLTSTCYC